MDQSAFRQLVSSQQISVGGGGGGNAEHDRGRNSKRVFGKSQKRTGTANTSNKDEIQLVPRKLGKNATSTEEEEEDKIERARLKKLYAENYTDRAAARRSGQEELNEFNDVEKLKEDFTKRLECAKSESERQQLRQQMSFLGGDAKHTVLVNGLDFALLEQQRAKMNGDDDLENAFNSNPEKKKMEKITHTNTTSQIKNDKFKPIGSSKTKEEESPEYIWRNGKRMRKKRKENGTHVKSNMTEVTQDDVPTQSKRAKLSNKKINKEEKPNTTPEQSNKEMVEENENSQPKAPSPSVEDMTLSKNIQIAIDQTHAPVEDSEEEDEDIFAGAGRWDGGFVDEASDEDGAV